MIRLTPGEWRLWLGLFVAMIILGAGVVAPLIAWLAERAAVRRRRGTAALYRTCGPCNGGFGGCQCPHECGDPHCRHAEVGDDTLRMLAGDQEPTAEEIEREIDAMLDSLDEGGYEHPF